jgi:hypothetical protein
MTVDSKELALANAAAGLEELKLLDNGILEKIEELEKNILYRRFYIPGGPAKRLGPGKGTDTDLIKFDGNTSDRDIFEKWDPRYLDDYVQQARQKAFHKWFLYFDGTDIVSASFAEAANELKVVDFVTGLYWSDKNDVTRVMRVYGLISGLQYFGKVSLFTKDYSDKLGITTSGWKKAIINAENVVRNATNHLQEFMGYTSEEFIENDDGYMVGSDRKDLWFASDLMDEWTALQKKYEEYKQKIWEILKNSNVLNICSNRVSGVNVGNVSIAQEMSCINKIGEIIDEEKKVNETPSTTPSVTTPSAKPAINVGTNSTSSEILVVKDPVLATAPLQTAPKPVSENISENNGSNLKEIIIIIIICIIGIVILVGIYLFTLYKKRKQLQSIEENE